MSSEQSSPTATTETWWRNGVVYQVYPRSFADANGDGTGDVHGIIDRLDHLEALGIDAIWISPWYPSPLLDGGYDVVDYRDIDPRFGTLHDASDSPPRRTPEASRSSLTSCPTTPRAVTTGSVRRSLIRPVRRRGSAT